MTPPNDNAVQAGGPRIYIAPDDHPVPEVNNLAPGAGIAWESNAEYTLAISGSPTGGTYTVSVTVDGVTQTTSGLAYNANAAAVQTAIRGLSNVGSGNCDVTGSAPFTIEFVGDLANTPVTLTASGALLTGGTSPAATPTQVASGYGYSAPLVPVDDVTIKMKETSEDFIPVYELWRNRDVITMQGIEDIQFSVAHRDVSTLAYVLGAVTKGTTAAGADQVGYDALTPTGETAPQYYRMIAELTAPGGGYYLLIFNKVRLSGEKDIKLGHSMTKIQVTAKCFKPTNQAVWTFIEQTADAAS